MRKRARPVLCGGRPAMIVPTVTPRGITYAALARRPNGNRNHLDFGMIERGSHQHNRVGALRRQFLAGWPKPLIAVGVLMLCLGPSYNTAVTSRSRPSVPGSAR
jgi:hypothetical protein